VFAIRYLCEHKLYRYLILRKAAVTGGSKILTHDRSSLTELRAVTAKRPKGVVCRRATKSIVLAQRKINSGIGSVLVRRALSRSAEEDGIVRKKGNKLRVYLQQWGTIFLFSNASSRPASIAAIKPPIVGFVGTIADLAFERWH
jgi:hypothetical protein